MTRRNRLPAIVGHTTDDLLNAFNNIQGKENVVSMAGTFKLFLHNAALRYPKRTFVVLHSRQIRVEQGGAKCGDIAYGYGYGKNRGDYGFKLTSTAIKERRERTEHFKTNSLENALGSLHKDFDPPTTVRVYKDSLTSIHQNLTALAMNVRGKIHDADKAIQQASLEFTKKYHDQFLAFMQSSGNTEAIAAVDTLVECKAQNHALETLRTAAFSGGRSSLAAGVIVVPGGYLAVRQNVDADGKVTSVVHQYAHEELPPELQNAPAVQMFPKDQVIEDMGINLGNGRLVVYLPAAVA